MNDEEIRQLEEELSRLTPRAIKPEVEACIHRAMEKLEAERGRDHEHSSRKSASSVRKIIWLAPMSLAACLLLGLCVFFVAKDRFGQNFEHLAQVEEEINGSIFGLMGLPGTSAALPGGKRSDLQLAAVDSGARFRPVRAENALEERADEGLVFLDDGLAARRIRLSFVDTVTWENPTDGSTFEIATPRDEIFYLPVAMY